jgi:tRNA pseudouridine38-40 synthase
VRNIAGALLAVGDGRREQSWISQLLASRDRTQGADTAAPGGLYLVDVQYDGKYGLPTTADGPLISP